MTPPVLAAVADRVGGATLVWLGACLVVAAAVSAVAIPPVMRLATSRGWLDHPGGHKSHTAPVPYLGGVAVVLGVLAGAGLASGVVDIDARLVWGVVGVATGVGVMGLVDDLREVPVAVRLLVEVGAGLVLYALGARAQLAFVPGIDIAVTVLWVVGVTNAVNLVDNMDGLSSGVAAVAAGGLAVIAAANGQADVAAVALAVVGACLAFLRANRHPARIHLGDAGALFVGVLLSALTMALRFDAPRSITFAVPIMILGVPLFDMALVVVHRLRVGRSPFTGGRDHTSHRLTAVGIPVPAAVTLIHGAGLALSWLALVLSRVDAATGLLLQAFVVAVGGLVFVLLSRVPVDDV